MPFGKHNGWVTVGVLFVAFCILQKDLQHQNQIIALEQKLADMERKTSENVNEIISMVKETTKLDFVTRDLEKDISTLKKDSGRIENINTKVGALEKSAQQQRQTIAALAKKLSDPDNKLASMTKELQVDVNALKKDKADVSTMRRDVEILKIKMNDLDPKVNNLLKDEDELRRRLSKFQQDLQEAKWAINDRNPIVGLFEDLFDWITGRNHRRNLLT